MPDRVRESLFGMLRGHCEGAAVFDAFSGTGAIGLEAVSRGASRCVLVEKDRGAAEILQKNIDALNVGDRCELVVGDALGAGAMARCPRPVTLAFFDPPYPLVRDAIGWKRMRAQFEKVIGCLSDDGFAILRTPWPFLIEVAESPAAPERKFNKPRKPRRERKHWRFQRDGMGQAGQTDEAVDEEELTEAAPETVAPDIQKTEGDLAFSNAAGPETHIYHSMAVHLYTRKRG
jgi:16S rRNA (guanine966-N2)-methyltransferase